MGFNLQSYYLFKKKHAHPPVRHDHSASIIKFASVVTNIDINTLAQIGCTSQLETEERLSSTTRKFSPRLGVIAGYARSLTTE